MGTTKRTGDGESDQQRHTLRERQQLCMQACENATKREQLQHAGSRTSEGEEEKRECKSKEDFEGGDWRARRWWWGLFFLVASCGSALDKGWAV